MDLRDRARGVGASAVKRPGLLPAFRVVAPRYVLPCRAITLPLIFS